ncbi:MAG: hypothetical protein U5L03_02215 [Burkholderiaceae bacterium]|nr:hypothetical protein [Burkholderiaceae bacterium]
MRQGSPLPLEQPIGYVMSHQGRPVGAIELNGSTPRLWRPAPTDALAEPVTLAALALAPACWNRPGRCRMVAAAGRHRPRRHRGGRPEEQSVPSSPVARSTRQFGPAICRAFADEGAQVIVTDLDEAGAAAVARAIGPAPASCTSLRAPGLGGSMTARRRAHLAGSTCSVNNAAASRASRAGAWSHDDPEHVLRWRAGTRWNLRPTSTACSSAASMRSA